MQGHTNMTGTRPGRKPHHDGPYRKQAAQLRHNANNNPNTRCAKCGHTHAEAIKLWGTKRAAWTAGHINNGETGGQLRPEHLHCNTSAGATHGNQQREPHTEKW